MVNELGIFVINSVQDNEQYVTVDEYKCSNELEIRKTNNSTFNIVVSCKPVSMVHMLLISHLSI